MPSINESNDFQQGGCLYKLTDGIQWTSEHLWHAPEKADQSTFDSGVLAIS